MKIGICSWSDREEVYSQTWPLLAKYCEKHGYSFNTNSKCFEDDVAGSWMKLKMLQQQDGLDYLVWFDDDIVITNLDQALDIYISKMHTDSSFGVSKCSGTAGQGNRFIFNMGLMITKCGDVSKNWLERIWVDGIQSKWRTKKLWEQDYITQLYKNVAEFTKQIHLFEYGTIQTYVRPYGLPIEYAWKAGDFSAHITGQANNNRAKNRRIQEFLLEYDI
tara:strand:- start:12046 stop:12702 length:657 start_codon:yes stop_codon:yes gene_type:complete